VTRIDADALVTVVVPTLARRVQWLQRTLQSIRLQDHPRVNIDLVAPVNSVTRQIAESCGARLIADPETGLSEALNTAWRSRSEAATYWTWIGDDDLLAPGSVARSVKALDRNPAAAFSYGRTRIIDAHDNSLCLTVPTVLAPRYARWGQDNIPQPGSLLRCSALMGSERVVDPSLDNAMDLDLFLRLVGQGWSWEYLPVEVSAYRIHDGTITHNKGSLDESERVRMRYRGDLANRFVRSARPAIRIADRVNAALQWRLTGRTAHHRYYAEHAT
jgi:hypothetical protein